MNPWVGWTLAALALYVGWRGYGWPGIVLALTVITFWLLLQFSRAVRVMRLAGRSPVGYVDSAVMLNAKLRRGMRLWEVVTMTRSLGRQLDDRGDHFGWADPGGSEVRLTLRRGRLREWKLLRPDAGEDGR